MAERLLQLLTLESASPTARNHAAKVIEYIGSHPDGARQMVERGMHETVRPARARAPSPKPRNRAHPRPARALCRRLSTLGPSPKPSGSGCAGAAAVRVKSLTPTQREP